MDLLISLTTCPILLTYAQVGESMADQPNGPYSPVGADKRMAMELGHHVNADPIWVLCFLAYIIDPRGDGYL